MLRQSLVRSFCDRMKPEYLISSCRWTVQLHSPAPPDATYPNSQCDAVDHVRRPELVRRAMASARSLGGRESRTQAPVLGESVAATHWSLWAAGRCVGGRVNGCTVVWVAGWKDGIRVEAAGVCIRLFVCARERVRVCACLCLCL